ncbi:MAG: EAL domain-containing protein [Gammaproteobacteria bacterium]
MHADDNLNDAHLTRLSHTGDRLRAGREKAAAPETIAPQLPVPHRAHYAGYEVTSVFQPVYRLYDGAVVGFEALARIISAEANQVSAAELFAIATARGELPDLDGILQTAHVMRFARLQTGSSDCLFINVHPESATRPENTARILARALEQVRLVPSHVVIEVLEHRGQDLDAIRSLVAAYRAIGCNIALDDFGASHSNFDRVWDLAPDLVKLDRSLHTRAVSCGKVRRMLPKMVALLHEVGCLALVEGIESECEALLALDSGADMIQGYYFGSPAADLMTKNRYHPVEPLWDRYAQEKLERRTTTHRALLPYTRTFRRSIQLLESGVVAGAACVEFLALPDTEHCYLLDTSGRPHEANISLEPQVAPTPEVWRISDCLPPAVAFWAFRSYFKIALDAPGHVHVTGPYLSYTGRKMCVTLSAGITVGAELVVLCGDIDAWALDQAP